VVSQHITLPKANVYDIFQREYIMKTSDDWKSLDRISSEQNKRENTLLAALMEKFGITDLGLSESDFTEKNNRLLFLITTEMEDTQNAIKETEQVLQKLKKHLQQLKGLQDVLSK
jgi:hypothetical protein